MNIVLIGYMACGKSTIGKKLAKSVRKTFIDLDYYIEKKENKSISEIFKDSGELYFRKLEKACLNELLNTCEDSIISLGGGTPCYYDNMEMLIANKSLITVYLKVSIPELVNRLKTEKTKRPLISHIKSDEDLAEFIGKHLFERASIYNQAELIIDANNNADDVVEQIVLNLF